MKDLVQELRELAELTRKKDYRGACVFWNRFSEHAECSEVGCYQCRESALRNLADRIEADYERRPEPDTVEKVALDMVERMIQLVNEGMPPLLNDIRRFRGRLENPKEENDG